MRFTRKTALSVAAWLAAAACVCWALARLAGLERGWPAIALMAFAPYAGIATLMTAIVVLALRRWAAGAVALLAALSLVAAVVPRATADRSARPTGPTVRVLTANLLFGDADVTALLAATRRLRVDVVALQEFTPEAAARLDAAGVGDTFPHRQVNPLPGAGGSAIFSRYPLSDTGVRIHPSGWHFAQAQATVTVPGGQPFLLESVHPTAPSDRHSVDAWERGLRDQPAATPRGPLRVLAGDFNATLDHAAMRRIIDTGYRDAADVAGAGLRGTWPYDEKWYLPGVALDRVLADARIGVGAVGTFRTPHSDHKAFYADLVLPKA